MKKFFMDAGFTGIIDVTAAEISKPDADGKMNTFQYISDYREERIKYTPGSDTVL